MIGLNSRYVGSDIYSVRHNADEKMRRPAIYAAQTYPIGFQFTYYTTVEGDRIDSIAERFYGNSNSWWFIAAANPEVFYPGRIEAGTVIRVPNESARNA